MVLSGHLLSLEVLDLLVLVSVGCGELLLFADGVFRGKYTGNACSDFMMNDSPIVF